MRFLDSLSQKNIEKIYAVIFPMIFKEFEIFIFKEIPNPKNAEASVKNRQILL